MDLADAKKIVFEKKPAFAALYNEWGSKTWAEYAAENYKHYKLPKFVKKHSVELLTAVRSVLGSSLEEPTVTAALKILQMTNFVSTADHHGILCHPFFSNNTILRSSREETILTFACGGISLTNSSYPRGIFFHDKNLKEIRMPFVSRKTGNLPVYGHEPITKKQLQSHKKMARFMDISKQARKNLVVFFDALLEDEKMWELVTLSNQFTRINNILWHQLFGEHKNLIYVSCEDVVRELLLTIHLVKKTPMNDLFFDPSVRERYIENFDGITGAHAGQEYGTHFFWHIKHEYHTRVPLWINGNELVSPDNHVKISLDADSITQGLKSRTLLPSTALCYRMLSFYYGLTLGGGFSQIQYLGEMKKAYEKTLSHPGKESSHSDPPAGGEESPLDIKTNIFTGECVQLGLTDGKKTVPATLFDILLWNRGDITQLYKSFKTAPLQASLDLMIPEYVQIITGKRPVISNLPEIPKTLYVD